MNEFFIRKATENDIDIIVYLFGESKRYMVQNGNPNQWPGDYPGRIEAIEGIKSDDTFVMEQNDKVVGTFRFVLGADETYAVIKDGAWISDLPYGTIHKIASMENVHGIFDSMLAFCKQICPHIRIDTHEDNKIMLHLISSRGFNRCGIIYTDNGTERIAFESL